jgi:TfoX/Sxy family transcriptional regulator of competence genes
MAFDEALAARIRALLADRKGITEKKMFGGIAFLLGGRMCCGVLDSDLVARVSAEDQPALLRKPQVRPMDFTGRPLKGFLYVGPAAIRTAVSLGAWIERCVAFARSLPAKPAKKRPAARKKK